MSSSAASRLPLVDPVTATGDAKAVLDQAKAMFGSVPNMVRSMANSPAVARVFLDAFKALSAGVLDGKEREAIALAIAQVNGCDYCLSAHTAIGKMHGLTPEQMTSSRSGRTGVPRLDAIVALARAIAEKEGHATDDDLASARAAGLDNGAIAEVVAHVAIAFYTNYFNHVANPPIDFPVVRA
jgi:uncharacterized peroxidase-related enzyme